MEDDKNSRGNSEMASGSTSATGNDNGAANSIGNGDTAEPGIGGAVATFGDGGKSIDGNTNETGGSAGTIEQPAEIAAVRKKRGRPPKSDAEPAGNVAADPAKKAKSKLYMKDGFRGNNREMLRQNIQGIHAVVATLTNQPVFALTEMQADSLTNSLCDVPDYHKINITDRYGVGAMYLTLAVTLYQVYWPMIKFIMSMKKKPNATAPAMPADLLHNTQMIDLSGDIQTVN